MLHIHIMYKICVKWLFTFSVRLLINTTLLVVIFKFQGSQKLYLDFWLLSGVIALSPHIAPRPSRVCPSPLGHILHKTSTFASSYLLRCPRWKNSGSCTWHTTLSVEQLVSGEDLCLLDEPQAQPVRGSSCTKCPHLTISAASTCPRAAPPALCSTSPSHSVSPKQHSTQLQSCLQNHSI